MKSLSQLKEQDDYDIIIIINVSAGAYFATLQESLSQAANQIRPEAVPARLQFKVSLFTSF